MTPLTASRIYNEYLDGTIDKSSAIKYFFTFIETGDMERTRIDSIYYLNKLPLSSDHCFRFLENLMISDESFQIKLAVTRALVKHFPQRAYQPIKWILENVDWNPHNHKNGSGLKAILKQLRKYKHPLASVLLAIKDHVLFSDKIFLVKNHTLRLTNVGIEHIGHIEGLNNLNNLKHLDLSNNSINIIRGIENLTKLETLNLANNQIEVIEGLDSFNKLQRLDLSGNNISKIEGLENLPNLKYLHLDKNRIRDICGLDSNLSIHSATFRKNQVKKIKGLQHLVNLFLLDLQENRIERIENLDNLNNLRVLRLTKNRIREIRGLDNLKKLTVLNLGHNELKKIVEPKLPNLYFFNLEQNHIPPENLAEFYQNRSVSGFFQFHAIKQFYS